MSSWLRVAVHNSLVAWRVAAEAGRVRGEGVELHPSLPQRQSPVPPLKVSASS